MLPARYVFLTLAVLLGAILAASATLTEVVWVFY